MGTTTIQISRDNAKHLEEVAAIMRRIFPDLFATTTPNRDQVVGFLAGQFLSGITEDEIDSLAKSWIAARQ